MVEFLTKDTHLWAKHFPDKLYNVLATDLVGEILSDYPARVSSHSLQLLPASDEDLPPNNRVQAAA